MASLALAFDILAKDKGASRTFQDVGDKAESAGRRGERAGRALGSGLKFGALAAAAGIAAAAGSLVGFIGEAKESQRISKLTEAVLASTGGVANVSAGQVDKLATALSNKSAVDDELIQTSANVLLTFTNIRNEAGKGNDIFNQGAEAALNMSAALGTDLQGATVQVGKALNDPIKGVTALSKAGVQFTDQQKEQIRTLVESGDVLGAQKVILGELGTQFAGAAEAAASPLDRLKVIGGNLAEQVGGALLPSVERFATYLGETVAPRVASLIEGFQNGTGAGGKLREGFESVYAGAVIAFDFFRDEVLPRLKTFAAFVRDEVVPRVQEMVAKIRDDVLPRLREFGQFLQEKVFPALSKVAGYLKETFQPTADALVALFREKLVPGFEKVKEIVDKNRPAFEKVALVIGTVAAAIGVVVAEVVGFLLPILTKLVGYIVDAVIFQFKAFSGVVTGVVTVVEQMWKGFQTAKDKVKDFIDKIKDVDVPQPLKDIAEIIERIGGAIGGAASGVAGFVSDRIGDVAGSFRGTAIGGPALARVQSVLPSGLRITSTYRSPADNARVGGSPTSKHMDRSNPAVDIAGPVYLMDQFAAQLAAMGGWRQLLYRVAGHYDHIHVAHNGGMVSSGWKRQPGDGPDERTARLQVGERVLSRAEVAAGGSSQGMNVTIQGPDPYAAVAVLERRMHVARIRSGMGGRR